VFPHVSKIPTLAYNRENMCYYKIPTLAHNRENMCYYKTNALILNITHGMFYIRDIDSLLESWSFMVVTHILGKYQEMRQLLFQFITLT
jgi:hypothetical protein